MNKILKESLIALLITLMVISLVGPMTAQAQGNDVWQFISETVTDSTCFTPGQSIEKTLTFKNAGDVNWNTHTLAFAGGDQMSAPVSIQIAPTVAGGSTTVTIYMITPTLPGTYKGNWNVKNNLGTVISSVNNKSTMWVEIVVATSCGSGDVTSTTGQVVVSGGESQPSSGGHWVETSPAIPEASHNICSWNTWFGCAWWTKVIDRAAVPATSVWVPDVVLEVPTQAVPQFQTMTVDTVVFADPQLELLYQVAKSNNPQMSYTDEQYRQVFIDWYSPNSKTIFASEFDLASKKLAYVKSSEIIAMKGGVPGWLYALAAWTVTTTVVAMNAELAANLHLPTITLASQPLKIVVLKNYSTNTTETQVDAYLQATTVEFSQVNANAILKNGKIIYEGVGPITWVVSSGLTQCLVDLQVWHLKRRVTLHLNNTDWPKTSPCTPEYIRECINQLIRQGLEAGISLELMNDIGSFVFKSIAAKFGW